MGRPSKLSKDIQKELVDKVLDEITRHKNEELDRFTTNVQLAREYDVSNKNISKYLKYLSKNIKEYRTHELHRESGKIYGKIGGGGKQKLSKEQQKELVDKVLDEITRHKNGELDRFTQNTSFVWKYDISIRSIIRYLKLIPEKDRRYRAKELHKENMKNLNS